MSVYPTYVYAYTGTCDKCGRQIRGFTEKQTKMNLERHRDSHENARRARASQYSEGSKS